MMTSENQGCLGLILNLFGLAGRPNDLAGKTFDANQPLPFRLRNDFLSAAELSFFHVLRAAVGEQYIVVTKVRVSDLLFVVDRRNNLKHANRIDRKHVDFVLCDPKTMQPRLVIELDDASHSRAERADRDELVDSAFGASGLPIIHLPVKEGYSPNVIRQQIDAKLKPAPSTPPALPSMTAKGSSIPVCAKCRIPMLERKANRGVHKGKRFWACPSYPDCREVLPID